MSATLQILLIEDNPGDVELVKLGFADSSRAIELSVIGDGQQALDYFNDSNAVPQLILLDINLPKASGHEILKEIRSTSRFQKVPVVMMSSSAANMDVDQGYQQGINSFITKPSSAIDFMASIKMLENYWFDLVKLPSDKISAP